LFQHLSAAERSVSAPTATAVERLESRRLLSGGDLDTTFGVNGRATLDAATPSDDYMSSILALPGGGFLAGHTSFVSASQDAGAFSKHLADGRLDPSFGNGGLLRLSDNWGTVGIEDMFLAGPDIIALGRGGPTGTPYVRAFSDQGSPLPASSFNFPSTGISGTPIALLPRPGSGGGYLLTTAAVYSFGPSGALVSSFGTGGGFTFPTTNGVVFRPTAFSDGPNGTLYVAGALRTVNTGAQLPAVARLISSGAFDGTFGSGGVATLPALTTSDQIGSVAMDAAGRAVVSGKDVGVGGAASGVLVRLLTSGAADTSFDGDGYRQLPPPAGFTQASAADVLIDAGGKIWVAGVYTNSTTANHFVARLTSGGLPDATFAGDGVQETVLPPSAGVQVWYGPPMLDPAAAGGLVMGIGTRPTIESFGDSTLFRITATGQRDLGFGTPGGNGTTVVAFAGASDNRMTTGVRQPDGKLVFVGYPNAGSARWLVGRLNADGAPDAGFGAGGMVQLDWGAFSQIPNDVKIDSSGRIVIAGWVATTTSTFPDVAIARLTPSGQPDGTFGIGGMARLRSAEETQESGVSLGFQADGKIVVGGSIQPVLRGDRQAGVFRFNADGSLDATFASNGRHVIKPESDDSYVGEVFVLPDGAIVAVGSEDNASFDARTFVAKLTPDGAPDGGFGPDGSGIVHVTAYGDDIFYTANPVTDAAGRLYVPGTREDFINNQRRETAYVTRLTPAGAVDRTFGTNGTTTAPLRGDRDVFTALGLDPIGRLVVAAEVRTTSTENTSDLLFVRLHANGRRDTSFGAAGERQVDVAGRGDRTRHVAFTGDGDIVALGESTVPATALDFAAVRLTNPIGDGTPPRMTDAVHAYDGRPPAVRLTFSEDIAGTVQSTDFVLTNLATGQPAGGSVTVSYDAASRRIDVTYTQQPGALPDGNYRLLLPAGAVADAAETPTVEDFSFDFYVLAGDINRDRAVNGSDFAILAGNFGRSGMTFAQGDLNGDGRVDGSDFAILAGNFGKSVPAVQALATPAASASAAASPAARTGMALVGVEPPKRARQPVLRRRPPALPRPGSQERQPARRV
jgi:uncharacterized delta-60 repeat protein